MSTTKKMAKDVMRTDVVSLSPTMSLETAYHHLTKHSISGAPVVTDHSEVVGVVSQSDLLRRSYRSQFQDFPTDVFYIGLPFTESVSAQEITDQAQSTQVKDVMSTNVISVGPEDSIALVANRMRTLHVHRVIVLDKGKLAGIVTSFDLLQLLEEAEPTLAR